MKETDDEEEENVILTEESEDNLGLFQQETESAEIEKVTYLESTMADFSTNMYILIDNVGGVIKKVDYSYVYRIQAFDGGDADLTKNMDATAELSVCSLVHRDKVRCPCATSASETDRRPQPVYGEHYLFP
ncbi:hypothetical protein AVEN_207157-1 [Araneus ventricosus]|uniref:Uncharacterized protein n=1 Tax=Araneus ventricosus TaxID=182803 RepID=A0A4Y2HL12_ARAVE|nr:hypothetical protein AVEN_207157-1 [Araneus ventricosus]